jgi:hypothetical protein
MMMDKTKVDPPDPSSEGNSEEQLEGNLFKAKEKSDGDKEKGPINEESKEKEPMKVGKLENLGKTPEKTEEPPATTPPRKSLREFMNPSEVAQSKKGSFDVVHEVEVSVFLQIFL